MDNNTALQLARDAFSGSTTFFDANIRPELERDLRQFQSKHPQGSKYNAESYKSRSRFYRPKTRAMVRSSEASVAEAFFSSDQILSLEPVNSSDELQVAGVEVMHGLLQHRLTEADEMGGIPWFQTVLGAFQDAEVQGVCISHQGWDPKRDKPEITLIPRENFRFDPAADWTDPINTSPYLIWLRPMYVKDVKARMKPKEEDGEPRWLPLDETAILAAAKRTSGAPAGSRWRRALVRSRPRWRWSPPGSRANCPNR